MATRHLVVCALLAVATLVFNAPPALSFGENVVGTQGITYFDFSKIAPSFQANDKKDVDKICELLGHKGGVPGDDKEHKMYGITTNKKTKKGTLDWTFCKVN